MSNMHTLETRTVINLLQEGPPSIITVKRAIMLLIHLDAEIERLDAEIERLKGYNENLLTANTALSNEILDIKTEAIKVFAEKLKDKVDEPSQIEGAVIDLIIDDIDNLVKEMTEGKDGMD